MEQPIDEMGDATEITKNGKPIFKKIFLKRKKSSVRIKEKKVRQNRMLRKAITPKNALMALNEVKGVVISDFIVTGSGSGFTASVMVNNNQYEGKGNSKVAAKNDACEKALRDYVLERMRKHPRHQKNQNGEAMDTSDDVEMQNDSSDDADVPMINLASFALFKLFSMWENEGFEIPEMHPENVNMSGGVSNAGSDGGTPGKQPKPAVIRNELPANADTLHPATLLVMMRPGLTYVDAAPTGEKPNQIQNVYVIVDEQRYEGSGRSKKVARRNAAVDVCNALFGTNFEKTE